MIKSTETKIPLPLFIKGKVREVYDLGEKLLILSSDRISAYDTVLQPLIPGKGKILNQISVFWFQKTKEIVKNHFLTDQIEKYPATLAPYRNELQGRSMLVLKTKKIPIECVVRGYLSGSAWKEYRQTGRVCGIPLPKGIQESEKLPEPIFTPATKEEGGKHDQNISFEEMAKKIGISVSQKLREFSIALFNFASELLEKKGLILADTKFEFGIKADENGKKELLLIDECLTPDSSRLWEKNQYQVGISPPSFDKQFVRNYLDSIRWNRRPPAPCLPATIVEQTRKKYQEALERIVNG